MFCECNSWQLSFKKGQRLKILRRRQELTDRRAGSKPLVEAWQHEHQQDYPRSYLFDFLEIDPARNFQIFPFFNQRRVKVMTLFYVTKYLLVLALQFISHLSSALLSSCITVTLLFSTRLFSTRISLYYLIFEFTVSLLLLMLSEDDDVGGRY